MTDKIKDGEYYLNVLDKALTVAGMEIGVWNIDKELSNECYNFFENLVKATQRSDNNSMTLQGYIDELPG